MEASGPACEARAPLQLHECGFRISAETFLIRPHRLHHLAQCHDLRIRSHQLFLHPGLRLLHCRHGLKIKQQKVLITNAALPR